MNELIKIENLSKAYSGHNVIRNLSISIPSGRIIGILGNNGVGKSTILNLIAGVIPMDEGKIIKNDTVISYLLGSEQFYDWMKVKDAVQFYQSFYNDFDKQKALSLIVDSGISMKDLVRKLSTGSQEKLFVILAISRNVNLFLMDEPLGGIDPVFKKDIKKFLLANIPENATLIMVTHLLKDMETLFDEVIIMSANGVEYKSTEDIRRDFNMSVEEYYMEVIEHD